VIGQAVEVKNSIVSQGSHISHLNYVADSIIGENCNLGAGTVLANLRFDEKNIRSIVKAELVDTQRKKFGAVLGKGVKVGINTSTMPGVLIGENAILGPDSLVMKNVKDNQVFETKFQK
jgi:bifunctional UDP-N-acetylglucosamine pyrophosphorylase/glucosamine-1-phosphate N-acetyltransferase